MVCTVTNPAERRRRLARAYDILLGVASRAQQRAGSRRDEIVEIPPSLADDETSDTDTDSTRRWPGDIVGGKCERPTREQESML